MSTLRCETAKGVRHIVLCRSDDYNTITPEFRDELAEAIDAADADPEVRVMLLRAEGPAFCAGYALDWGTAAQAQEGKTTGQLLRALLVQFTTSTVLHKLVYLFPVLKTGTQHDSAQANYVSLSNVRDNWKGLL